MALKHAQALDIIDLHASDEVLGTSASNSLLKTGSLQLMRLVLAAGDKLPEHHVMDEAVIQCLLGHASVITPRRTCVLTSGKLLVLPAAEPHSVLAHSDTTLLLILQLRERSNAIS